MPDARIQYLFYRYFDQLATDEELRELASLLKEAENEAAVKRLMDEAWSTFASERNVFSPSESERILMNVLAHGKAETPSDTVEETDHRRSWLGGYWWQAAAGIVVALGLGMYYYLNSAQKPLNRPQAADQSTRVRPGGDRATLTLADGSVVSLDSLRNGQIASEGAGKVSKAENGLIVYEAGQGNAAISYNTIATPRGGQYRLELSDGTRVWLNAASSLRYPVQFGAAGREVELTGEAYFEVAKNAARPFRVKANGSEVVVLGTHFNVNAYADEPATRTTLLEGSVKVLAGGRSDLLVPGQQADIKSGSIAVTNADTDKAIAWKEGYFQFGGSSLQEVMRQLMRWYDIDVRYEGAINPRRFGGEISRDANLDDVLKILEISGVHFKLTHREILVMP